MGIPENYEDNAEQARARPMLLPKPDKAGLIPKKDLEILAKAMRVDGSGKKQPSELTPHLTDAMARQRSVLDDKRYEPGKRPYWEMKEGQERSRCPNLIRALTKELDPSHRRSIWEIFRTQTESQVGSRTVQKGVASR